MRRTPSKSVGTCWTSGDLPIVFKWTFNEVVFPRGVYGFDGVQTSQTGAVPTAANQFADFLLGLAHSLTLSPTPFNIHENSWNTNLYFQDNWRLTR